MYSVDNFNIAVNKKDTHLHNGAYIAVFKMTTPYYHLIPSIPVDGHYKKGELFIEYDRFGEILSINQNRDTPF